MQSFVSSASHGSVVHHEISDTERAENDPSSEANRFALNNTKEAQYWEYEALAKTRPASSLKLNEGAAIFDVF
jgi:hypothetical protein